MRVQMKLKEFLKRTMAMTVAVCMIMFQLTSDVTFASMEIEAVYIQSQQQALTATR